MSTSRSLTAAALLALAGCQLPHHGDRDIETRTLRADVVALDQPITYNRFGSFNPYGMIYALSRDVVEAKGGLAIGQSTCPGDVRLRDERRPRPLVLRGNAGDRLQVRFTNMLRPEQPNTSDCDWYDVPAGRVETGFAIDHGNQTPEARLDAAKADAAEHAGEEGAPTPEEIVAEQDGTNWPATRTASFVVSGMSATRGASCHDYDRRPDDPDIWIGAGDPRVTGIEPIAPGACFVYEYALGAVGTNLFFSSGAPTGGQGAGGSLVHGLFGSLNVQPEGSRYYRSQVTAEDMASARSQAEAPALIDFEAVDEDGLPLLDMLREDPLRPATYEIVHGDLNAIVVDCDGENRALPRCTELDGTPRNPAFRDFTVIFHDELKTFYPEPIRELGQEYQLEGIGDGFAINYGASGMGSILLANRKGFGPAKDCLECLYEEFFLQSWANGDPALLVNFEDDPSNVHHSYLGDRVEFKNLHAGPKETHVFHLHAHQWLATRETEGEAENYGTYLDSQTVAPQQGFAYPIHYGGSGNRNQTPGDSIFHCHLYPHFAQGMWALWRVHDVFEDGTRRLPDGQAGPGTDVMTGEHRGGTPIPALVPLPRQAMPPSPTYVAEAGEDQAMPGYPFYIAGKPGHRAPQPPLDFARDGETGPWQDGGLPRHVFTGEGERIFSGLSPAQQNELSPEQLIQYALRSGDFSSDLRKAEIDLLANDGEPIERAAMAFHAGEMTSIKRADGQDVEVEPGKTGYPSITPEGDSEPVFLVNGAEPKPGAPFADPCRADVDGEAEPRREIRYDVSAIELDLIVNKAGWHDPQARINVLSKDAEDLEHSSTGDVEPFFFRAESEDCIEFRHTNRTLKDLKLDDFQVKTPTDTIGQHIHLVKFDVTSSDGSGNGFNYEDGTLAPDEVAVRIRAAKAFTSAYGTGDGDDLVEPGPDDETFQTTVQRWYADPLVSGGEKNQDRTIRTVFTHDHFAPSSIQHHGFYSALLVEPRGATWRTADGRVMCPELVDGETICDVPAIGARAIITGADDQPLHQDHREFAMAIADFGLLYDPRRDDEAGGRLEDQQGLDHLFVSLQQNPIDGVDSDITATARAAVAKRLAEVRSKHGLPVDPPLKPESISKNHHNPYLVNYKNAPLGLRVGENGPEAGDACDDEARYLRDEESVKTQKPLVDSGGFHGEGDLSNVFSSNLHGDPCTPVIEAYEGEKVQIRMVQGAQEVQHMFEVQGMRWPREVSDPDSPLVAAQEIGISEHFEMDLPALLPAERDRAFTDYLYRYSTVDDLWNGAWGLLRSYGSAGNREAGCFGADCAEIGERLAAVTTAAGLGDEDDVPLPETYGVEVVTDVDEGGTCPADAPVRLHVVDAVTVMDVLSTGNLKRPLLYNPYHSIADWDALAFMPVHSASFEGVTAGDLFDRPGDWKNLWLERDRDQPTPGSTGLPIDTVELAADIRSGRLSERAGLKSGDKPFEPMVLRARAGECVFVRVRNLLRHGVDSTGEVIATPLRDRVDDDDDVEAHVAGQGGYDPRHLPRILPLNAVELQASDLVGITPQLVHSNVIEGGGAMVGYNNREIGPDGPTSDGMRQYALPSEAITYRWYAGEVVAKPVAGEPGKLERTWRPKAFGPANLVSLADPIEHGQQGLIGALIVEEADALFVDAATGEERPTGTRAFVDPGDGGQPFHEFVLMYQDGLNLRWQSKQHTDGRVEAIPDCLVCDDSYDRGEKAVNYRTEPMWARLNEHPTTDLNSTQFPSDFFLNDWKSIATPAFEVEEGEAVTFHVLQPYGRARQRTFMALGQDYDDLLPHFGSKHSALISVGKAVAARLGSTARYLPGKPAGQQPDPLPAVGTWLWRDGPAQHFGAGVWGTFEVTRQGVSARAE